MRRSLRWTLCTYPLAALLVAVSPPRAEAWKIETHIWIAQQVLNDLLADERCALTLKTREVNVDGTVSVVEREYFVEQGICASLRAHQNEYRMGAIGPDGFPDLVAGQMTTHPGVVGGWQTDQWLAAMLNAAERPVPGSSSASLAFAYGYLTHAAGDIFAHTYVNSYAGDIFDFELGEPDGERQVELRHMALEGYVKAHQPPLVGPGAAPLGPVDTVVGIDDALAGFLRDRLILNPAVAEEYRRQGTTRYLSLMYDHWKKLGDAIDAIEDARDTLNGRISALQREIESFEDQIDSLKDVTVTVFGKTFRIYPASCFLDPGTCLAVIGLEFSLASTRASLNAVIEANNLTAASLLEPLRNWRSDVELAVKEYIKTSAGIAKAMMKVDPPETERARAQFSRWLCHYGPVFGAIPEQLAGMACTTRDYLDRFRSGVNDLTTRYSDPSNPFHWLLNPVGTAQALVMPPIDDAVNGVLAQLAAAMLDENGIVMSLARLREHTVTRDNLDIEFSSDRSGKHLMTFPSVAGLIDVDMQIPGIDRPFDPDGFHAVHDAIVLSKLLLLGSSELNRLARDNSVHVSIYGDDLFEPRSPDQNGNPGRFNLLIEAVRSIDGNQQWQEFALRYPRAAGSDTIPHQYGYGFNAAGRHGGLRLWQDCEAKPRVFERLFKGPIAPQLSPLVLPQDPEWESIENAFPFSPFSIVQPAKVVQDQTTGTFYYLCGDRPAGSTWSDPPPGYVPTSATDVNPPTLVVPPDVNVECRFGIGRPGASVSLGEAIAVDDRDDAVSVTNDFSGFVMPDPPHDISVTWTATDSAQNSSQAVQMVRIVDTVAPTIAGATLVDGRLVLPGRIEQIATTPDGVSLTLEPPAASDRCDLFANAVAVTPVIGGRSGVFEPGDWVGRRTWLAQLWPRQFPIGFSRVYWSALDSSGNRAVAVQEVLIRPLRGDLDIDGDVDGNDVALLVDSLDEPVAQWNPDRDGDGQVDDAEARLAQLVAAGDQDPRDLTGDGRVDVFDVRELVRLWVPTDAVAPTVTCPAGIVAPNDPGRASAVVECPAAAASDNHPGVLVSSTPASGSTFAVGITIVTATANDAHGNAASCSFTVLVRDVEPPVIAAPAGLTVEATSPAGAFVDDALLGSAMATDNVPGVSVARSGVPAGNLFPLGNTTITYTATDAAGNSASAVQAVTVVDTTPPVIQITRPAGAAYRLSEVVTADYACTDAVSPVISCVGTVAAGAAIDTSSVGAKTFTVVGTDAPGNSATASTTYSVAYGVCRLYDPGRAARSGSTLPIRLQLCDANGANVSSPAVVLTAVEVRKDSDIITAEVIDSGDANPDDNFRFDPTLGLTGGYIFNLSTRGLAAGTYRLVFTATGDPTTHSSELVFQVK